MLFELVEYLDVYYLHHGILCFFSNRWLDKYIEEFLVGIECIRSYFPLEECDSFSVRRQKYAGCAKKNSTVHIEHVVHVVPSGYLTYGKSPAINGGFNFTGKIIY